MQEIQAHGLVYGISDRAVVDALLKSRVARAPAACSSSPTTTTPELQAQFTIFAWAKYITGVIYCRNSATPPPNSLRRDPPRFREDFRFRDF